MTLKPPLYRVSERISQYFDLKMYDLIIYNRYTKQDDYIITTYDPQELYNHCYVNPKHKEHKRAQRNHPQFYKEQEQI